MRLKEYHFDYVFCTYRFSKYKKIAPAALYVKVYILLFECTVCIGIANYIQLTSHLHRSGPVDNVCIF